MNIVIVGGGDVGRKISQKLIFEGHDVTIIEKNEVEIRNLKSTLDAMIITGDAVGIDNLKESGIEKASLFISVTNNDMVNMMTCQMAKKLGNKDLVTIAKIDKHLKYFSDEKLTYQDFGINTMITPEELSINKVVELIKYPEVFEISKYSEDRVHLIGIKVKDDFKYRHKTLQDINQLDDRFSTIRIVAIQRQGKLIIPKGDDTIEPRDKAFIVGKKENVKDLIKTHFSLTEKKDFERVIIVGGTKLAMDLAKELQAKGKKITFIENDPKTAERISENVDKTMVFQGSATDITLLDEIDVKGSCVVSVSEDDEYNILSSFTAKQQGASKTICMIKNGSLVNIVNSVGTIDAVFSPHILSVGEILKHTRKTNIFAITSIIDIDSEIIGLSVTEDIEILNKPLKKIKLPEHTIIGVIIRDNKVIIPTGDDEIKKDDNVIVFLLQSNIYEVEKIFSKNIRRF